MRTLFKDQFSDCFYVQLVDDHVNIYMRHYEKRIHIFFLADKQNAVRQFPKNWIFI